MKITCECGKEMEDSGKKVPLGSEAYYNDKEQDYAVVSKDFSLLACNWCGAQALFRKLEDDECYEL